MNNDHYSELCRNVGLRATSIRVAVLRTLHEQRCPIDVQQIETHLKEVGLNADRTTIYRILEKFQKAGIVQSVFLKEDRLRFELNKDHHHHLVCTSCGIIQAVHDHWLETAENEINSKYAFAVQEHTLEFFGKCKNCR